jgi:hypothetical protein
MKATSFPNLDLPVVDPQTGKLTKAWYQLIVSLYLLLGGTDPLGTHDIAGMLTLDNGNEAAVVEVAKLLNAIQSGRAMDDAPAPKIAELHKMLAAVGQQVNTLADSSAALATLAKRVRDIEVAQAFTDFIPDADPANGGWVTVTPLNGFTLFNSAPYQNARYLKDANGFVHLEGLLTVPASITSTTMLTLPPGFRPTGQLVFPAIANNALCRVDIDTGGNVMLANGGTAGSWISFGHMMFTTA